MADKKDEMKINPWVDRSTDHADGWELVADKDGQHPAVYRMKAPGGWLYRVAKGTVLTFVPEK